MEEFSRDALQEALRSIESTQGKCEKVLPKLREGTAQHTLTARRVKALRVAAVLIDRELGREEAGGEGECAVGRG